MRFVIIAAPRTGSTHLVNLLGRQPDIQCHGEVFGKKRVLYRGRTSDRNKGLDDELFAHRATDWKSFLNRIYAMDRGRDHVGFKIFEQHGRHIVTHLVAEKPIKKIFLYRPNLLAAYASLLSAKTTGVWGSKQRSTAKPDQKPLFVAEDFERFHDRRVAFYQRHIKQAATSGQKTFAIDYDELNEPVRLMNLLAFIGASSRLTKRREEATRPPSKNILGRFENREEAERYLEEKSLMHWAYEGELSLEPLGRSAESEEI